MVNYKTPDSLIVLGRNDHLLESVSRALLTSQDQALHSFEESGVIGLAQKGIKSRSYVSLTIHSFLPLLSWSSVDHGNKNTCKAQDSPTSRTERLNLLLIALCTYSSLLHNWLSLTIPFAFPPSKSEDPQKPAFKISRILDDWTTD